MPIGAPLMGLRSIMREAVRTKVGVVGLAMLGFLLALVIAVPLYAPYDVVRVWGTRDAWLDNPRFAAPEWTDLGNTQPRTRIATPCFTPDTVPVSNDTGSEPCPNGPWSRVVVRVTIFGDITFITLRYKFTHQADAFPSELRMLAWAQFGQNASRVVVNWSRPDGTWLHILDTSLRARAPQQNVFSISTAPAVQQTIKQWAISSFNATDSSLVKPEVTLFAKAGPNMLRPSHAKVLKGEYEVKVEMTAFGGGAGLDMKMVVYGKVFGLAGTDANRRDLLVGLLWGAPVALAFATVAAVVIVLLQMIIGAIATWFGGVYDEFVQRLSDFFLILPLLPILILISIIYSPGIWSILLVLIAFGVVGSTSKIARSIVLQVKEEPYIEAALSYGASRTRIMFKHIMPRLMPYTFALIALAVPSFIFLEASLSFLGLGDPVLPTWGSMLGEAYNGGAAFRGFWWWIALPAVGIVFATVAFALLGYAFDKVLNPRLREE